jgi:ParB family transcriptional regulator, chromosome partitioning protein
MARKPLGRGLGALIGGEDKVYEGDELLEIEIERIHPNTQQPRTRFAEQELDNLASSIKENGVVQPIIVRKTTDGFELIAGERRWRASQRAGLQKIPAVVRKVDDSKLLEIALLENIQRQELNPIEEAIAYRKLIETIGLTQEELSARVGKPRTHIATLMRFLKLPDDLQKLIEEERVSAGHARALLLTEDVAIQRQVARRILEEGLSVRATERLVKSLANPGGKGATSSKKNSKTGSTDPNVKAAEIKLRRHLATNVQIKSDPEGKTGSIEIEFYSSADLDRLYNLILGKQ